MIKEINIAVDLTSPAGYVLNINYIIAKWMQI